MDGRSTRVTGAAMASVGVLMVLGVYWLSFFWVSTEANQGVAQRIFYVHAPSAWVAFLAFGIVALTSAMYLWLRDDRLDHAALAAAEGGMIFATIMITTGPLWGKIAWGTYWTREPRLTLTLLLWFIYLGYFLVRASTENPERGKRFAAVVGIVGALDIPLIHLSVVWFRSLHPQPVVIKPEGPSLPEDMFALLMISLASFTVLFLGLFLLRYSVEGVRHAVDLHDRPAPA